MDELGGFASKYLCEFKLTEQDKKRYELATRYHVECEAYDRTVCTGPIGRDGILPADHREIGLIGRNAVTVRAQIYAEAKQYGIPKDEMRREISRWHELMPNVLVSNSAMPDGE